MSGQHRAKVRAIKQRKALTDMVKPGLFETLQPLPTIEDWLQFSNLTCFKDLDHAEKVEVAKSLAKIAYALREFEIADSMYKVSRCDCCNLIWIKDYDDKVSQPKKGTWRTENDAGWMCHCQNCVFRVKINRIHRESSAPAEHSQATLCSSCYSTLKSKETPLFSFENTLFNASVPAELSGLTYAEEAAIARIALIMNCKKLKGGVRSLKGNVSFLFQDQAKMLNKLPRIPSECSILVFKRKSSRGSQYNRMYKVRRGTIKAALLWLMRYSPAYQDLELSETALSLWPVNGYLQFKELQDEQEQSRFTQETGANINGDVLENHVVLVVDDNATQRSVAQRDAHLDFENGPQHFPDDEGGTNFNPFRDSGPAPAQTFKYVAPVGHTAPPGMANMMAQERSRATLNLAVNGNQDNRDLGRAEEQSSNTVEATVKEYVHYKRYDYFFSAAFPTLFVPDMRLRHPKYGGQVKEIPSEFIIATPRKRPITFNSWIENLLYKANDARYARHSVLKFALLNLKQRDAMLSQTRVAVKQKLGDVPLCVEELRQWVQQRQLQTEASTSTMDPTSFGEGISAPGANLEENETIISSDRGLGQKILNHVSNVPGTSPYWWSKRKEFESFVTHKLETEDELPVIFHSGSFAEYHCHRFHSLLEDYLRTTSKLPGQIKSIKLDQSQPLRPNNIDKANLRLALLQNTHLANYYFVARTRKWIHYAMEKGIGVTDYQLRFEFAKSRGFIHFHCLLYTKWGKLLHSLLDDAVSSITFQELEEKEAQAVKEIYRLLLRHLQITSQHPGMNLFQFLQQSHLF